ncbi:E3 ubiquitin-protein ligase APD1 [Linum grandiflorum]
MAISGAGVEWSALLVLLANLLTYLMVLGVIIIMIILVLKISSHFVNMTDEEEAADASTEIDPLLLQQKTAALHAYYGTYGDAHEESVAAAGSSSTSNGAGAGATHDDEEGQVKLCVICYDEERNSFFVPCGHSVTCLACAQRIFNEENKVCPVCRRPIRRLRKL